MGLDGLSSRAAGQDCCGKEEERQGEVGKEHRGGELCVGGGKEAR